MLSRIKDIYAREETVEGTYIDPLSAPYAQIAFEVSDSEEHEEIPRDTSGSSLSKGKTVFGRSTRKIAFGLDFKGEGDTTSTPDEPIWGPLMQACGMQKTRLYKITVESWEVGTSLAHGDTIWNHSTTPTATGTVVGTYAAASAHTKIVYIPVTGAFANSDPIYKSGSPAGTDTCDVTAGGGAAVDGYMYTPISVVKQTLATSAAGWTAGATTEIGEIIKGTKAGEDDCYFRLLAGSGVATGSAQTLYIEPIIGAVVDGMTLTGTTNGDTATGSGAAVPTDNTTYSLVQLLDGMAEKARGCRGTYTLDLQAGQPALIKFEFQGLSEGVADEPAPAAGVTDPGTPLRFHEANFSIDDIAFRTGKAQLTYGANLVVRTDANESEGGQTIVISDRDPRLAIDPEMVPSGVYDWRDKLKNSTLVSVKIRMGNAETVIGTASHDIGDGIWIDIPQAQVMAMPKGDRDGVLTGEIELACRTATTTGDDELKIYVV